MTLSPDQKRAEMGWAATMEIDDLYEALDGTAEAFDGCIVEPDGRCEHGYRSPLLVLGLI
jgi:hypothetical protein